MTRLAIFGNLWMNARGRYFGRVPQAPTTPRGFETLPTTPCKHAASDLGRSAGPRLWPLYAGRGAPSLLDCALRQIPETQ